MRERDTHLWEKIRVCDGFLQGRNESKMKREEGEGGGIFLNSEELYCGEKTCFEENWEYWGFDRFL